jgi:hypothetical protein
MKEWLIFLTDNVTVVIDLLALVLIVVGTVEAFFGGLRAMAQESPHLRFPALSLVKNSAKLLKSLSLSQGER